MVSLVNSQGTWVPATSTHSDKDKIENPGLVQKDQIKNRKHADVYTQLGSRLVSPALAILVLQWLDVCSLSY